MQTRYTIIERQPETEPGVEVTDTVCAGDVKLETVFPSVTQLHTDSSGLSIDRPADDGYSNILTDKYASLSHTPS